MSMPDNSMQLLNLLLTKEQLKALLDNGAIIHNVGNGTAVIVQLDDGHNTPIYNVDELKWRYTADDRLRIIR